MSQIVRCEFMGSWMLFWVLCLSVFGIPLAILYLRNSTIWFHEEVDDPERFVEEFRAGRLGGGKATDL
jgi:hypothetical protein